MMNALVLKDIIGETKFAASDKENKTYFNWYQILKRMIMF